MERGELSRGPDHASNFFFPLLSLLLHSGRGTEANYLLSYGWLEAGHVGRLLADGKKKKRI